MVAVAFVEHQVQCCYPDRKLLLPLLSEGTLLASFMSQTHFKPAGVNPDVGECSPLCVTSVLWRNALKDWLCQLVVIDRTASLPINLTFNCSCAHAVA